MLDNLRLGSTSAIVLTPSNTNIPYSLTSWTLPASRSSGFLGASSYTSAMINISSKNNTVANYGSGSGKVGVYYNYCAASAGYICAAEGENNLEGSPDRDICPKGWRIPTSSEYKSLYTAYSSNATNFRIALSTPLSGNFYNYQAREQNTYGSFWSSTRYWGQRMDMLYVSSSSISPQDNWTRDIGLSIRCIFK